MCFALSLLTGMCADNSLKREGCELNRFHELAPYNFRVRETVTGVFNSYTPLEGMYVYLKCSKGSLQQYNIQV